MPDPTSAATTVPNPSGEATFSLATQPWLPVLDSQGRTRLVSLVEAFHESHHVSIATGMSTTDHAVQRLLLAIGYTVLGAPTEQQYTDQVRVGVDTHRVGAWVQANAGLFDLLHPDTPFMQDASLGESTHRTSPPRVLDSTVARDRALFSDRRTLADTGPVSFSEAALLLLTTQAYGQHGIYPGSSDSLPSSPLTGKATFHLTGTVSQMMRWALIPTSEVGTARWSYTERGLHPGTNGVLPTGCADGLHWMAKRLVFEHDTTHVTGVRCAIGHRYHLPPKTPADTAPGLADMGASSTSNSTEATLPSLVNAWHHASATSLAGYIRTAVAAAQTDPPSVQVVGQDMTQAKTNGVLATALPAAALVATSVTAVDALARTEQRVTSGGVQSWPTDLDRRLLADPEFLGCPDSAIQIASALATSSAAPTMDNPWPARTQGLWTTKTATEQSSPEEASDEDAIPLSLDSALDWDPLASPHAFANLRSTRRITHRPDLSSEVADADDLRSLRALFHVLRTDPDQAEFYAREGRTGLPESLPGLGVTHTTVALRVMVVALATWFASGRRTSVDGTRPLTTLLRQHHAPAALTEALTSAPLAGLRLPLLDALDAIPPTGGCPSWVALYDDLRRWDSDPAIRQQWQRDRDTPSKSRT